MVGVLRFTMANKLVRLNNNKYLFTHKSIIFKNAVNDFKWVLTT